MTELEYEAMGRFIYGAHRYGGKGADVERWMADDIGIAAPAPGDDAAVAAPYQAFFAKHTSQEQLQENHARFMESLKSRHT